MDNTSSYSCSEMPPKPTNVPEPLCPIKVAAVPLDIVWADREANIARVGEYLEKMGKDTDVVVLPELFTTSFTADQAVMADLAEGTDGPTIRQVKAWAVQYGCAMAGSYLHVEKDTDGTPHYYNNGFIITPDGREVYYAKRHLFCLSPEAKVYTAGDTLPPTLEYKGWKLSIIICYDLRFPVWDRCRCDGYEMMLVPANWPDARGYAWTHLLIGRAIENQAVYVGANRSGSDDFGTYGLTAHIYDAMGMPSGEVCDGIVYASFNLSDIHKARRRLPAGHDADRFTISL